VALLAKEILQTGVFPAAEHKCSQMLTKWPKLKTFYCLIDVFKGTSLIHFSLYILWLHLHLISLYLLN